MYICCCSFYVIVQMLIFNISLDYVYTNIYFVFLKLLSSVIKTLDLNAWLNKSCLMYTYSYIMCVVLLI